VRSVLLAVAVLLWAVPGWAAPSAPPGWRFPNPSDRTDEWQGTPSPFHIRGDFNGDGLVDDAWILLRKGGVGWAVFAFLRTDDGTARPIKLLESTRKSSSPQRFVLETIRPSKTKFPTACGKGYFECGRGEPLTLQFRLPSISFCLRESSCSVFVWQPASARFQQIRMSD
jgi:hypothetical protein